MAIISGKFCKKWLLHDKRNISYSIVYDQDKLLAKIS